MFIIKGTTIVGVKKNSQVALAGDGQVTLSDNTIIKHGANKVRTLYNNKVLAGFAGSAADAVTLFEKFEAKLEKCQGNLQKAAVELAKDWRLDRVLRRLEALMVVCDSDTLLVISGSGEIIEPDDNVIAIGSGGPYALAAAKALYKYTDLSSKDIAVESLKVTAEICVYTNNNITFECLE